MNAWLKTNRCPFCIHHDQPACPYTVRRKISGGFRCYGYKSRAANDEWSTDDLIARFRKGRL